MSAVMLVLLFRLALPRRRSAARVMRRTYEHRDRVDRTVACGRCPPPIGAPQCRLRWSCGLGLVCCTGCPGFFQLLGSEVAQRVAGHAWRPACQAKAGSAEG